MQFRPCIDIHNGAVKQIVGSSLSDNRDQARENFVSEKPATYFASYYRDRGIAGGHVILLNHKDSPYYEATRDQALSALSAYPGGLQIGGGITNESSGEYLKAGASHVIVTSYVFHQGQVDMDRLSALSEAVGPEHLVLDLSCKRDGDTYVVCTDRWQKTTEFAVNEENLDLLAGYCDEFLVHAVDAEGKSEGIEEQVALLLGDWIRKRPRFYEKVTYAGGIRSLSDLELLAKLGDGGINATIGSSLDLFGGTIRTEEVLNKCKELNER